MLDSGDVTVYCSGTATIGVSVSGSGTVSCPGSGTLNITSWNFWIKITGDDQTSNGSHLTSLVVVPTVYVTRYRSFLNGHCPECQFTQNYLSIIAPFRVLRGMDWSNANNTLTSNINWANRPTTSQPFYNVNSQAYGNGQTYSTVAFRPKCRPRFATPSMRVVGITSRSARRTITFQILRPMPAIT